MTSPASPLPRPRGPYTRTPEDVWRLVRRRFEAGEPISAVARTFRIPESTVRNRAARQMWLVLAAPGDRPEGGSPLSIAETALARALESLALGKAADALALIKAGDAVGAFADFVDALRRGGGRSRSAATPDAA